MTRETELTMQDELQVRVLAGRLHGALCKRDHFSSQNAERDCYRQFRNTAESLFLDFPLRDIEETLSLLEKKRRTDPVLSRLQNLLDG